MQQVGMRHCRTKQDVSTETQTETLLLGCTAFIVVGNSIVRGGGWGSDRIKKKRRVVGLAKTKCPAFVTIIRIFVV